MPARENIVVRACLQVLRSHGAWAERVNSGAFKVGERFFRASCPGFPDICACWRGRFIAVEAKAPADPIAGKRKGTLRPAQRAVGESIDRAGGVYLIVDDAASLDQWLEHAAMKDRP